LQHKKLEGKTSVEEERELQERVRGKVGWERE